MTLPDPPPQSVLRHPPFLFYWAARTAASMAWQIQAVAVGWQIYELTSNPFDLGLVGLAEFLPLLAFILAVGPVADRFDRRKIMQISQTMEACAAAALALGTASGAISKDFILIAVFILGTGRAFDAPTSATVLPAIVPSAMFPQAVATSASATQFATIAGPAIGGFLYAISPTLVYVVCSASFLASVLLLALMRMERRSAARAPVTLASVFAGVHYISRNPIVLGAMSLDLFAVLLGGAVALLPVYARDILDVGPWGLGMLRAAPAVGALTTIAILTRTMIRRHVGKILFAGIAAFGLATIVFALSTSFPLTLFALVVIGASDSVSVVTRSTLIQLETVDAMRGRVSAVNSLFIGTSNALGAFRAGTMAAWLGAVPSVLIGGIGTIVVAALCVRIFSPLYRINTYPPQRMSDPAAANEAPRVS
jgi:MFS family permease